MDIVGRAPDDGGFVLDMATFIRMKMMLNIITVRHPSKKRRTCRGIPQVGVELQAKNVLRATSRMARGLSGVLKRSSWLVLLMAAGLSVHVEDVGAGRQYVTAKHRYQGSGPFYMYNGEVPGVQATNWLHAPSWIGHRIDSWVEGGNWVLTSPSVSCEYGDPEYLFRSIRIHNVWHDNKEWGKIWMTYNITNENGQWECYEPGACLHYVGSGPLVNSGKMSPYLGLTLHPVPDESDRFKCVVTYAAVANSKWQTGIAVTSTVEVTYDPIVTAEINLKHNYDCKTSGLLCTTRVPLVVVTRPRGVKLSGRLKIDGARHDNVTIRGKGGVEQRIPAYMTLIPYDESYIDVNVSRGEDDSQLGERTINLNLTWESI